jgi:hypothetical protein
MMSVWIYECAGCEIGEHEPHCFAHLRETNPDFAANVRRQLEARSES